MSQTGEHPAVPDPKEPTFAGLLWGLANLIFKREAVLVVSTVVVLLTCGALGIVWAQDKLDGGAGKVDAKLTAHITEEQAEVAALNRKLDSAEERNARRFEVLYNAVLERRSQPGAEELKQPATDGGR